MFKIYGGANKFKQWTQDNKLIMDELPIGADVMFYNDPNEDDPLITEVYEIRDEEDNVFRVCDVPNILLTETKKIKVRIPKVAKGLYGNLYKVAGRNEMIFEVEPAEKPSDYVYEKTATNTIDPKRLPEGYPYKESVDKQVFALNTSDIGGNHNFGVDGYIMVMFSDDEYPITNEIFTPAAESFPVGTICKVTWDDDVYLCKIKERAEHVWYLGNLAKTGISDAEDTGEPFLLDWGEAGLNCYIPGKYISGGHYEYELHNFTVTMPVPSVVPMSAEFLPTSVPAIESASVGQVPKVAAVDENGVPTKWEAGEAGGQQIQSDWNQNDENAPDYVKNRLCYKYTEFIDAVSETTLNATTASEGYYTATIQGNNYHLGTESASVVYDGTTYENVPASHNESWAGGAPQSTDTIGSIPEYPFKIVMRNGTYENNLTLYAETQGEHTFCIKKPVNKVKKLDNEYIPNNVASLPGIYHGDTAGYPILYVSGFEEDDNGYKRASDFSALSMSSIEGWTFTLEDGTTVMKRVGIFR